MRDLPYSPLEEPRVATDYDRYAGFFLAMSLWQIGEKEKGRLVYAEAIAYRDERDPDGADQFNPFLAEKLAVHALAKKNGAAEQNTSNTQ